MAKETAIITGEQSVTTTGAITGTLATSALSGNYSVSLRVRGLNAGQGILIGLEDTASGTPFSDAVCVWSHHFYGGQGGAPSTEGDEQSVEYDNIPLTLFGATNNALRFNAYRVTGSPTALVEGWLSQ